MTPLSPDDAVSKTKTLAREGKGVSCPKNKNKFAFYPNQS